MANRVELTGSHIVIESVCGERGWILLDLMVCVCARRKRADFFFLFPDDWEINIIRFG
jgi:hypothetical protein